MTRGDYTFRCHRGRREPEWTRVLAQASDAAAIEEARLMLQSQAALRSNGELAIRVGRGREDGALTWLGAWRLDGGPRWEPGG
jgi:hypothetical protein